MRRAKAEPVRLRGCAILARVELTLTAHDGTTLSVERRDLASPRARVIIVHGYGEHRGRYGELAERLLGERFECHLFDLRGHGRSGGVAAHVERFSDYVSDLALVVDSVRAAGGAAPLFLVAHSLGGLIALTYACTRRVDGLAASSPFLRAAFEIPAARKLLAMIGSRLTPAMSFDSPLAPEWLSRDQRIVDAYTTDPLVHRRTTPRWFVEVQHAQRALAAAAPEIRLPLFMMLGEDDRVADHRLTLEMFERFGSSDKTLRVYPGLRHEVFNELERDTVIADLVAWLRARS